MKLYIDTSDREKIILGLDEKRFTKVTKDYKSQQLLPFIKEILDKESIKREILSEIEVNIGPGSFTGLRVGVSVAQTLGWVLNIAVNGKDIKKGEIINIKYD